MATHLEELVAEWLEFKGYFVRRNVKVGKLSHGGHEGELDIVAYHPGQNHLLHVEPSIDGHTWQRREQRFRKKFDAGKKYIIAEILPWLPHNKVFDQWAVLWASDRHHAEIGGGRVVPMWALYRRIARDVLEVGDPRRKAIPEPFPLLRTIQFTLYWAAGETGKDESNDEAGGA